MERHFSFSPMKFDWQRIKHCLSKVQLAIKLFYIPDNSVIFICSQIYLSVADPGENLTGALRSNFGRGGRG